MSWRIALCRGIVRLVGWIESIPLFLLKPDDIILLSQNYYSRITQVEAWSDLEYIQLGLSERENKLLEHVPHKTGNLLLLGLGGGREAIPLAKQGYQVTGVDFVPEMVAHAISNARLQGVEIKGLVQEISSLDLPPSSFDIAWFSSLMYSATPTRSRRIAVLQRLNEALKPNGCLVCQFSWNPKNIYTPLGKRVRLLIAYLTSGNRWYEDGDNLPIELVFDHNFTNQDELIAEFTAGGFEIHYLEIEEKHHAGSAILVKKPGIDKSRNNRQQAAESFR